MSSFDRRQRYNVSQIQSDDYSFIGASLGAVITPALLLHRARLPVLMLGGASVGLGAGVLAHIAMGASAGRDMRPEGMVSRLSARVARAQVRVVLMSRWERSPSLEAMTKSSHCASAECIITIIITIFAICHCHPFEALTPHRLTSYTHTRVTSRTAFCVPEFAMYSYSY